MLTPWSPRLSGAHSRIGRWRRRRRRWWRNHWWIADSIRIKAVRAGRLDRAGHHAKFMSIEITVVGYGHGATNRKCDDAGIWTDCSTDVVSRSVDNVRATQRTARVHRGDVER